MDCLAISFETFQQYLPSLVISRCLGKEMVQGTRHRDIRDSRKECSGGGLLPRTGAVVGMGCNSRLLKATWRRLPARDARRVDGGLAASGGNSQQ